MQAGRAKNRVNSASPPVNGTDGPPSPAVPPGPTVDELLAKIAAVEAEKEELRKRAGILTEEEIAALPTSECFYEFQADKKTDRDEPIGERLKSLDDPRWNELLTLRQSVVGQVIVENIVRAKSGEELRRIVRTCVAARSPGQARSMMEARAANPSGQWY